MTAPIEVFFKQLVPSFSRDIALKLSAAHNSLLNIFHTMSSIRKKFELHGRNYIVTGGAMGIGFAITKDICEMGGNVAVLDLKDSPLEDVYGLAKTFNVKTSYHQADVSDEKSLQAGFAKAVEALGRLDGIVTAAGIAIDKPYTDQKWDEVNKVIQVNVSESMLRRYQ